MDAVLALLIEQATARRERQSAIARQARMLAGQAQQTQARLQDFRGECLARSPASSGAPTHAGALAGQQQFLARLDDAIGMQARETDLREQRASEQQAALLHCQQRVLAFEALARRREQQRLAREQRQQQRESDEFAARAARRKSL